MTDNELPRIDATVEEGEEVTITTPEGNVFKCSEGTKIKVVAKPRWIDVTNELTPEWAKNLFGSGAMLSLLYKGEIAVLIHSKEGASTLDDNYKVESIPDYRYSFRVWKSNW
jgi:hypothetical protein